jgi:hypothetical protein
MTFHIKKAKYPLSIHVVWIFIIIFVVIAARFLPPSSCTFHELTGLPCLSCGAIRALNSLLSGDIIGTLYANPLLVLFCGGLFFFSLFKLVEYIFRFKLEVVASKRSSVIARVLAVILIAANWLFLIVTGR